MDEFAARLGATWTTREPWEFLSSVTDVGGRMAGSVGEERAATLVAEAFREAGLSDVRRESFGMTAWERDTATMRVTAPVERGFRALALPYSPSGEAAGRLVDAGHGTPAEIADRDVDGAVVVASTTTPPGGRFVHRMEKYGTAVEAGANAFVFTNHVPGQLPPTGSLTFGDEAPVPAVGVSKETGDRLRAYAVDGTADVSDVSNEPNVSNGHDTSERDASDGGDASDGTTASDGTEASDGTDASDTDPGRGRVTVSARIGESESHNVYARTGPETDRELLVTAHHDAHDVAEGALDNGCGITTLVTVARLLADADLARGVRFAAVGSEEVGLLGSSHLAATTDLDRIAGVVNCDGVGRFRNLVAMSHTSEATAAAARAVAGRTRHPIELQERPHPFSDQWPFVREGVPALQLHSTADDPPAALGGLAADRGRGWGHTEADTRDKVDVRNVREHAMLAALLIRELAGRDLPRLDLDDTREAFREADFETGMRAANLWPDHWD